MTGDIGKAKVLERGRRSGSLCQGLSALLPVLLIQHRKDALRTGDSGLHLAINLRVLIDRAAKLFGIDNKGGEQAVDRKVSAKSDAQDKAEIADAVHNRPHDAAESIHLDPHLRQRVEKFSTSLIIRLMTSPLEWAST